MGLETAETIDVHAHAVLEETMGAAGAYGPELGFEDQPRFRVGDYELHGVKYRNSAFMDPELRLAEMDKVGIDYQLLSPNPLTYFHWIEADQAQGFCRTHNDALAELVKPRSDRLGAAAAVLYRTLILRLKRRGAQLTNWECSGPTSVQICRICSTTKRWIRFMRRW